MTGSAYNQGAYNRDFTVIYITSLYLVMKDVDLRLQGVGDKKHLSHPLPSFFTSLPFWECLPCTVHPLSPLP